MAIPELLAACACPKYRGNTLVLISKDNGVVVHEGSSSLANISVWTVFWMNIELSCRQTSFHEAWVSHIQAQLQFRVPRFSLNQRKRFGGFIFVIHRYLLKTRYHICRAPTHYSVKSKTSPSLDYTVKNLRS